MTSEAKRIFCKYGLIDKVDKEVNDCSNSLEEIYKNNLSEIWLKFKNEKNVIQFGKCVKFDELYDRFSVVDDSCMSVHFGVSDKLFCANCENIVKLSNLKDKMTEICKVEEGISK